MAFQQNPSGVSTLSTGIDLTSALAAKLTTPGAWTSYVPTLTNVTLGTGGAFTGYYTQVGKTVHCRFKLLLGTGGSLSVGAFIATLPVTGAMYGSDLIGTAYMENNGVLGYGGFVRYNSSTEFAVMVQTGAGAGLGFAQATTPFTWADGDFIIASFTYEAA